MSTSVASTVARQSEKSQSRVPAQRHIITCEYPPQRGGVSDYTQQVARGLAEEGEQVHVWCPKSDGQTPQAAGVCVHRDLGHMAVPDLRRLDGRLNEFAAPRRILVQWVPHGYGYRSMNLHFCAWLWKRKVVQRDHIELFVHEPFLEFSQGSFKQDLAAAVHRIMIVLSLSAARRVWLSTSMWEARLRPYSLGRAIPFRALPIPSNIPVQHDPERVQQIRNLVATPNGLLIGHFGTYGANVAGILKALLPLVFATADNLSVVLLGKGSNEFRDDFIRTQPFLTKRVYGTGDLGPAELSAYIQSCDLMLQPYPDGISSRRTSAIASLAHGRPMITTSGALTERFWARSGAVALIPVGDSMGLASSITNLLNDENERNRLGRSADSLYSNRFHLRHTIAALGRG